MPSYFSGLVSVRLENHGLLNIGPVDLRANEADPFENLFAGVSEPVVLADGNHRIGRPDFFQEFEGAR